MSKRKSDFAELLIDLIGDIGNEVFQMGVKMITGQRTNKKFARMHIKDGIPIGNIVGSRNQLVLPVCDARHKIVQGATRMGKTEWAVNYVVNRAKKGQGTAFLDNADGSAAQRIFEAIPRHYLDRVVVLDHSNKHHPLPIGLIAPSSDVFTQDTLMNMWLSFFVDNLGVEGQWMTQELILNTCKAAFAAFGNRMTLLEIIQVASDPFRRAYVLSKLDTDKDSDVIEWWNRFDEMSADKQRFVVESFMRRAGVITTQKILQHMLCQIPKQIYNYRKWIDDGYIVLIICKESMGNLAVRIVMSMHLLNFWLAAMSRDESLPEHAPRKPFVIVADEPQTWLPGNETILDNLYSKGLKYGLGIISMFQSTAQVAERSPKLLATILDNQPDLIFFRTNKSAVELYGYKLSDIKQHHFVAKIGDNEPIECKALPPVKPIERRDWLVVHHASQWGRPWEEVAGDIKARRKGDYAHHRERQEDAHSRSQAAGGYIESTSATVLPFLSHSNQENSFSSKKRISNKTSNTNPSKSRVSILSLDDGQKSGGK